MTFCFLHSWLLQQFNMSFLFSIPNIIKRALEAMLREVQLASVRVLAQRFGFDVDEAMRVLDTNGEPEVIPEYIPLAAMPWMGIVDESKCDAIGFSKGLYTQCQGEKVGEYCRKCTNLKAKSENGTLPYGDVHARMQSDVMEYKNVRPFLPFMEKNGWTKDQVIRSAEHYKGTVDQRNFQKKTRARGRPANAGMVAPPVPVDFEETRESHELVVTVTEPVSPPYVPEPVAEQAAESESESEDEDAPLTEDYVNGLNKADLIVVGKRLGINLKENGKPRKMADVKEEIIQRFIHGNGGNEE
jgi:hypothetical protein